MNIAAKIALRLIHALFLFSLIGAAIAQSTLFAEKYDEAASHYQNGNYAQAEVLWGELADQGDANSQYALGIMHLKKEASKAKDSRAFAYLVDAAKQQHLAAIFNLGVAYWEGRGIPRQQARR